MANLAHGEISVKEEIEDLRKKCENLGKKYEKSCREVEELKAKLSEANAEFEKALEPACEEYKKLYQKFEIEKNCRYEAEKFATKMRKQCVEMKRKSQMLVHQMQGVMDVAVDELDFSIAEELSEDERGHFNRRINHLDQTLKEREHELLKSEESREELMNELSSVKTQLEMSEKRLQDQELYYKNITQVSEVVAREYDDLKMKHEQQMALRSEAEKYAHKMLAERNAIAKESSAVLSSVISDERLMKALEEIEELTRNLELEKVQSLHKIRELEQVLEASAELTTVKDLQLQLDAVASDNDHLQKALNDSEFWKNKLEKENRELIDKLDVAEQKLRPAAPPPAPPLAPSLLSPIKKLLIKKKIDVNKTLCQSGACRDKTYDQALKEMMERIKSGSGTLRKISVPEVKQPDEMDNFLQQHLRRRSGRGQRHESSSEPCVGTPPANSELYNTMRRFACSKNMMEPPDDTDNNSKF